MMDSKTNQVQQLESNSLESFQQDFPPPYDYSANQQQINLYPCPVTISQDMNVGCLFEQREGILPMQNITARCIEFEGKQNLGIVFKIFNKKLRVVHIKRDSIGESLGIKFNDHVETINDVSTYGLSLKEFVEMLNNKKIKMLLKTTGDEISYKIKKTPENVSGINFSNGRIITITPESPAAICNLPLSYRIIRINGKIVVHLMDHEIFNLIKCAPYVFTISLMNADVFNDLFLGIPKKEFILLSDLC